MKKILYSILITSMLPNAAIAAPEKATIKQSKIEQSNCRRVAVRYISTDGGVVIEIVIRWDIGPNGQVT
jgi:hypothetical protein